MTDSGINLARHADAVGYWQGGNFELNLSFDSLTMAQWRALMDRFWAADDIEGPVEQRYVPHHELPPVTDIIYPEPTATYTQHGMVILEGVRVGMDALITRSLFECFSVMIPVGMFANPVKTPNHIMTYSYEANPARVIVDGSYKNLALLLYEHAPFTIASIGWNRECQLISELRFETEQRERFFKLGNCLITDTALRKLDQNPAEFEAIQTGLRWLPPPDA